MAVKELQAGTWGVERGAGVLEVLHARLWGERHKSKKEY